MPTLSLNASKKTKQTPAGEIPVDWGCVKLGELLDPIQSGTSVSGEDIVPDANKTGVLKVSAVTSGIFKPDQAKRVTGNEVLKLKQPVVGPSILVNRANGSADLVGSAVIVKKDYDNLFLPDKLWQLRPILDKTELLYLGAIVTSEAFRRTVLNRSSGGTGMLNISSKSYLSIPIPLPPLPEQRKIADILGTWDRALETLDQLIAAKTRRKQALMQQLLTGKKRLPGFSGEWETQRFSDFLKESRIPGSNGSTAKKLTVKLYGKGVFAKDEKRIGSANTKYYTRRAGQFIYSKLDFLNGAFGIIPKDLDGYESTLDLPAFEVSENADIRWLLALVSRPHFYSTKVGAAAGGRKARRINPPEFLSMKIDAPGKAEQTAIAQVLDTADHELRLLKQQRTALEQQKRGLMQQLLTGKVRVKV